MANPNIYGMLKYMSTEPLFNADEMINAQNQGAIKNAFKSGAITNPDGSISYDKKMTLGALVNNPTAYMKAQEYFSNNEKTQRENELANQGLEQENRRQLLSAAIGNQPQYGRFRQEALNKGFFKPEELPENYDENFLKFERDKNTNFGNNFKSIQLDYLKNKADNEAYLKLLGLDVKRDQFDQSLGQKKEEFKADSDNKKRNLEIQETLAKLKELLTGAQIKNIESQIQDREADNKRNDKKVSGKGTGRSILAPDQKKYIETLSSKTANQLAIKNELDSFLENYDSYSDKEKISQGRQLLKTLNSTQGADAIGVEEAKRLGSALEFSIINLNNPNPLQFGYDLKGFGNQVKQTRDKISSTIQKNQNEIDKIMGRSVQQNNLNSTNQSAQKSIMNQSWKDAQAFEMKLNQFMKSNKLNRKEAIEILKQKGLVK